jgi:type I restriction enzyme M protein
MESLQEVAVDAPVGEEFLVQDGDILFVRSNGNPELVGRSLLVPSPTVPTTFSGFTIRCRFRETQALPAFYAHLFKSREFAERMKRVGRGASIRNLNQGLLGAIEVPLPPLDVQRQVVQDLEREQALVTATSRLVEHFEGKVQGVLTCMWGEGRRRSVEA